MLTGNRGEWSEIYTFLRLLSEGKLHAADSNVNRIQDIYYPLVKILRNEAEGSFEYEYGKSITIMDAQTKTILLKMPIDDFKEKSLLLFEKIKEAKGRSFAIPEVEDFLKTIKCHSLKANSSDKTDIHIMVHDHHTGMTPLLGFSIKSQLGGASTLLNAGRTTNFIYEIKNKELSNDEIKTINEINTRSKIRDRIKAIENVGGQLHYVDMANEMFKLNLQVIDTVLPEMISRLLLYYYRGQASTIVDLLSQLKVENPFLFNDEFDHNFYEYKLKGFIRDVALGMTPSNRWNGEFDATGGYIIVKEDGEVLCYHIYNHNEFQNYLLKNTKLDTPSSSRYDFGYIYRENGKLLFKLNLQIRFI